MISVRNLDRQRRQLALVVANNKSVFMLFTGVAREDETLFASFPGRRIVESFFAPLKKISARIINSIFRLGLHIRLLFFCTLSFIEQSTDMI